MSSCHPRVTTISASELSRVCSSVLAMSSVSASRGSKGRSSSVEKLLMRTKSPKIFLNKRYENCLENFELTPNSSVFGSIRLERFEELN